MVEVGGAGGWGGRGGGRGPGKKPLVGEAVGGERGVLVKGGECKELLCVSRSLGVVVVSRSGV